MKKVAHLCEDGTVLFNCPGCNWMHGVSTTKPNSNGAKWSWNGSEEKPTFSPSVLVTANYTDVSKLSDVCHSFVRDGNIQFLSDCTHGLAGQTVPLPSWDEDEEETISEAPDTI